MSKKRKTMIGVVVGVVVCLSVVGVYKLTEPNKETGSPIIYTVDWTIENTSSAWIINIVNTHVLYASADYEPNWSASLVTYRFLNISDFPVDPTPENYIQNNTFLSIQSISGTPSPYNVTWNDNDDDGCLSGGDNFTISKTGGSVGKAESGYTFIVIIYSEALIEVTLP